MPWHRLGCVSASDHRATSYTIDAANTTVRVPLGTSTRSTQVPLRGRRAHSDCPKYANTLIPIPIPNNKAITPFVEHPVLLIFFFFVCGLYVAPVGRMHRFMGKMGIKNCVELSWWEEVEVQGGAGPVRLASTPAQHWSTRVVWDRNTRCV